MAPILMAVIPGIVCPYLQYHPYIALIGYLIELTYCFDPLLPMMLTFLYEVLMLLFYCDIFYALLKILFEAC